MANQPLVLSLFPGIGLLDMAFEAEGFCVVRGPDVLWGGDIRRFHPPAGVFDGVIGGPPCQAFSPLVHMVRAVWGESAIAENLIPEYERVVAEAEPEWFVMENAKPSPLPVVAGYRVWSTLLDNRWLGEIQQRCRRISFGTPIGAPLPLEVALFESMEYVQAVNSSARHIPVAMLKGSKVKRGLTVDGKRKGPNDGNRLSVADMLRYQGFSGELLDGSPFTISGKRQMVANGVPLPMGRAIARAVKRAIGYEVAA